MTTRKSKGGGGLPGRDLTTPGSPRYNAELVGIAVRLPKDRVNLALKIIRTRNEHARRDGRTGRVKLSEVSGTRSILASTRCRSRRPSRG
jgi:hypothetical protein